MFSFPVLDEIHERDILSDFLITILKDLVVQRSDLTVILMSATLNADQFSRYFSDCPMTNIPGFTFPVVEHYLEDVLELTQFKIDGPTFQQRNRPPQAKWHKHTARGRNEERKANDYEDMIGPFLRDLESCGRYSPATIRSLNSAASEEINVELVAALVGKIHSSQADGAILVFMTGWDDISKLHKLLSEDAKFRLHGVQLHPLHSLMPTANQRAIFARPPPGKRKVVIATNIAETSITIEDVVYVIDCGKIKMTKYDAEANIATLQPEWVSLANARQRRGRAGRVQPGVCYHLYTRAREMTLSQFVQPEMLRTRLEEVVLQVKILELGLVAPFLARVMDRPDERAVRAALDALFKEVAAEAGVDKDDILNATFVGNPIMHHLLLGIDPTELGGAPFALAANTGITL